jgi:hypothetical protein
MASESSYLSGKHIELNVGNVLAVTLLAVVGVGFVGSVAEYLATQTNIPVVTPAARGVRHYLGWSLHQA